MVIFLIYLGNNWNCVWLNNFLYATAIQLW